MHRSSIMSFICRHIAFFLLDRLTNAKNFLCLNFYSKNYNEQAFNRLVFKIKGIEFCLTLSLYVLSYVYQGVI